MLLRQSRLKPRQQKLNASCRRLQGWHTTAVSLAVGMSWNNVSDPPNCSVYAVVEDMHPANGTVPSVHPTIIGDTQDLHDVQISI
jgi:hypothetical protein